MERDFALRLSNKGMDKVRAEWKAFGNESSGAVNTLNAASMKVTPSLKAVDDAAMGVKRTFEQWAGQVPVIGGFLQSIGPWGLAAGAGLAALGAGALAIWENGQKARETLDQLKTSADNIGTSAETFQVLEAAALEADIGIDKLTESMGKLRLSSALATKGKGELAETLKKLNPELLKEIALAETQEDRWNIVSRAITAQTSETEKIIIAKAAFGEQGGKLVRLLDGEGRTIEKLTAKYRELGLVIDEETVAAVAEADRRLDLLNRRMEMDSTRAGAAMVPVVEAISTAWNGALIALGQYIDSFNAMEVQQTATLKRRLKSLQDEFAAITSNRGQQGFINSMLFGDERGGAELDRRMDEIRKLQSLIWEQENTSHKGVADNGAVLTDLAEQERLRAEAARNAAEALRQQQALEKQAIGLRKELGDWTGVYAAKVAELTPLVGQYGVTQEMVNKALAAFRDELDGTSAFASRTAAAIASLQSPAEKAREELAAYVAEAVRLGKSSAPETILAIRAMDAAWRELGEAEAGAMTKVTARNDAVRRETFATAFAMEGLNAVFNEQMRTLEDLEDVALYTFQRIALGAIDAASQVKGASLGDIFGAVLGAFGFGGSSAPAALSGNAPSSSTGTMVTRVHHDGRVIGDPGAAIRLAPSSLWINAPRHHSGMEPYLRQGERAIIAEDGERMFSRVDNARIVRAIERGGSGGGGNMTVNIHPPSGYQAETRETQGADGGRSLEVTFTKFMKGIVASGGIDREMGLRYGVKTQVGG